MTRTFLDAGVLIAAARGRGIIAVRAHAILDDVVINQPRWKWEDHTWTLYFDVQGKSDTTRIRFTRRDLQASLNAEDTEARDKVKNCIRNEFKSLASA